MKQLILICSASAFFASCRKDVRQFTTDFQDQFTTRIEILYDATANRTTAGVAFMDPIYFYIPGPYNTLELPSSCELKINNQDLTWTTSYYELLFDGKSDCEIFFQDADGKTYINSVSALDTAFFVNLPDTVSSTADLQIQVEAPLLDSTERIRICLDSHGDDYGDCFYIGLDSIMTLDQSYLKDTTMHTLYLYCYKSNTNPNLPLGGGSITYTYATYKSIYSQW